MSEEPDVRAGHRVADLPARSARTHDQIARADVSTEFTRDLRDRRRRADEQHAGRIPAALPHRDEPLPPQPAGCDEHQHTQRQTDEQEASRDIHFREERDDRDRTEQPHARIRHAEILGRARTDHAIAARVAPRQRTQPEHDQADGEKPVRHGRDAVILTDRELLIAETEPCDLCAEHHPHQHDRVADPQAALIGGTPTLLRPGSLGVDCTVAWSPRHRGCFGMPRRPRRFARVR
ncbi:hypothetical protein RR49_00194 [Microbacterium ginsengisoli]|uniref:Uncharacterized protein n=1 Tax=Microbacterium ginsengisoli TaxID=400772 RepID=A0A0F0LYC5_9MICO|nr:hypothetical protein RR49_00194 [Microbacterium ginsengisoli]